MDIGPRRALPTEAPDDGITLLAKRVVLILLRHRLLRARVHPVRRVERARERLRGLHRHRASRGPGQRGRQGMARLRDLGHQPRLDRHHLHLHACQGFEALCHGAARGEETAAIEPHRRSPFLPDHPGDALTLGIIQVEAVEEDVDAIVGKPGAFQVIQQDRIEGGARAEELRVDAGDQPVAQSGRIPQ